MEKNELIRFTEIFLKNNTEYESIIFIFHSHQLEQTEVILAANGLVCPTMLILERIVKDVLKQINNEE